MNTRVTPRNTFNNRKTFKTRWLLLLVFVLFFALVASTSAQEEGASYPGAPAVPETQFEVLEVSPEAATVQATFFTSQDAYLSSAQGDTNFGKSSFLNIGYGSSSQQALRMLFQFNLSQIPQNSVIHSATIAFWQTQSIPSNDADMGFKAQLMKTAWSETAVTWNNANYLGGTELGVGQITNVTGWKSGDVTNVVRQWVSGATPNYGVIFTGDESVPPNNRSRVFYARETAGFEPRLTVVYDQSCDNVAPTAWVETLPAFSTSSFNVSWTGTDSAPSGCTPVGIAYYDVQYNINGGTWTNWQMGVTNTTATFSNAQSGQTYQFRARGVDNAGNVQEWTASQAQTVIDTTPPTASVDTLPLYSIGPSFPVSWSGSDNSGGSGIANYGVQFREGDGGWQTWLTATTATSANFTGGKQGVTYEFKARATDNVGNAQPWPDEAQASTTVVLFPIAIVDQFDPWIHDSSAPDADSFEVSWTGYTISSMPITGYNVQYRFNNGPWTRWLTNHQSTSATFDMLEAEDGTYFFEAAALSVAGSDGLNGVWEAFTAVDMEEPFITAQNYQPVNMNNGE